MVGVQVAQMQRVAMSQTCGIQEGTVVVNGGRSIGNLVATVTVHVSHGNIMCALTVCTGLLGRDRDMKPLGLEPFAVEVHRPEVSAGVVAAAHHGTGALVCPVEEGHAGEVTLAAVALVRVVAPRGGIGRESVFKPFSLSHQCAHAESAVGIVPHGVQCLAGLALKDGEQFRSRQYAPALVAIVGGIVQFTDGAVGGRLTHWPTLPVHRTGRGLADHLRLAVTVEVVDEELGVVGSGADVLAQVDAPELGAIQLVAVEEHFAGIAVVGIVVGVGRVPFQDDFILAVAVHVAHTTVVGAVGIGSAVGSGSALRTVEGQRPVKVGPGLHGLRHLPWRRRIHLGLLLVGNDAVAAVGSALRVGVVGDGQLRGNDSSVALHVEAHRRAVRSEHPPTEEHALVLGRQCHHATVQFLHLRHRGLPLVSHWGSRMSGHRQNCHRQQRPRHQLLFSIVHCHGLAFKFSVFNAFIGRKVTHRKPQITILSVQKPINLCNEESTKHLPRLPLTSDFPFTTGNNLAIGTWP